MNYFKDFQTLKKNRQDVLTWSQNCGDFNTAIPISETIAI